MGEDGVVGWLAGLTLIRGGGGQTCLPHFQMFFPLERKVRVTSNQAVNSSLPVVLVLFEGALEKEK